ncbi:MAG TPA: NAD(P)/FAD-dependent oxidoreductase [archaeon]|nr:NAD(P)/FAD-dependent oxidoreductase [archaeon]
MAERVDVAVIGAGPAGLSASLYLARAGFSVVVIGFPHKSQLEKAHQVGNYLGWVDFEGVPGTQLIEACLKHARKYGVKVLEEEVVHAQLLSENAFKVKTETAKEFECRAIIIASGVSYRKSGAQNEDAFVGKGVHYCVACDGYFYKGKKVAVLGSGNYAAEEALELTGLTQDVTIISQGAPFKFSNEMKALLDARKVKLEENRVTSFKGEKMLESMDTEKGPAKFDGVFIAVGTASTNAFSNKLGLELNGIYIKADRDGRTNLKGVYAAGGCTGGNVQMAKSVGEGCNAAISCIKDLSGKAAYVDYT